MLHDQAQDLGIGAPPAGVPTEAFIGFVLGTDEFLLPMDAVREIIMLPAISYLPHAHPAIEGLIALRGEILPVVNMRRTLGLNRGEASPTTRIVVLQVERGRLGIIIDAITEFVHLRENERGSLSQGMGGNAANLLAAVGRTGDKIRGIIDIGKVVELIAGPKEESA